MGLDPAASHGLDRLAAALAGLGASALRVDGHPVVLAGQVGMARRGGAEAQAVLAAAAGAAGVATG